MEYEIQEQIHDWKQQVDDRQKANYALSVKYDRYHYWIGISVTLLITIAGATLLTEVEEPSSRITAGILGILAAILAAFQTFYSLSKRAEKHRFVVSQLVHVRRDIEIFERFIPKRKSEREERIHEIEEKISNVEEVAKAENITAQMNGRSSIPQVFTAAVLLILLIALGKGWFEQIPATQQSEVYAVRESIQQGVEAWEFDPKDPLVQQRVILINTLINEMTTQKVITLLAYLNERDNEAPITIYLSSTGGNTKDAYAIVHAIQGSEAIVNTAALGDCFSACTKILMGGTGDRKIAQDSRIMIHTHAYPYNVDPYAYSSVLYEREREFWQTNSNIPIDWIDREEKFYYLTPEQAITYQLADEILK